MSSLGRLAAAVRMITPPVKPRASRNSRTISRSRLRSSRDSIFRDTPTRSTVGMNTRKRPAMVTCEVRRAPLVPSGSFTTCTRISWPSWSRSSILGWGLSLGCASASPDSRSPKKKDLTIEEKRERGFYGFYNRLVGRAIAHRWSVLIGSFVFLVVGAFWLLISNSSSFRKTCSTGSISTSGYPTMSP